MEAYKLGYTGSEVAASLDALGKNGKNFCKIVHYRQDSRDRKFCSATEQMETFYKSDNRIKTRTVQKTQCVENLKRIIRP